jgi:[ribosomal protein S18]-alanine N-acetyltransferase
VKDSCLISKVSLSNIEQIVNIEKETQLSPWSADVFSDCLGAGYDSYQVTKDKDILGYYFSIIGNGEAQLLNLVVKKEKEGLGIGHSLMTHFISLAKKLGALCIYLEVRTSNTRAINFYKKKGFIEISTRKNYYRTSLPNVMEDALIFKLDI